MRGVDILIYANTGTEVAPEWTAVGGQRNATLSESSETIDITSKDSSGAFEYDYGLYGWNISCDGLYVNDDVAFEKLRSSMRSKSKIQVKVKEPGTTANVLIGYALVTSSELEMPYDDSVTYSVELQGTGTLTESAEA